MIAEEGRTNDRKILWKCKCECGHTTIVRGTDIRSGHTQSCGCLERDTAAKSLAMNRRIYPPVNIGNRYGKLLVIGLTDKKTHGKRIWLCCCDCGNTCEALETRLSSGVKKSCGCYSSEFRAKQNLTHGGTGTRLYSIWTSMKTRCNNPKSKTYEYYGGKGISVCPEWEQSFEAFRDWALANGYADNLTLDRIDGDKGYAPENCRWATWHEQRVNQKRGDKK